MPGYGLTVNLGILLVTVYKISQETICLQDLLCVHWLVGAEVKWIKYLILVPMHLSYHILVKDLEGK